MEEEHTAKILNAPLGVDLLLVSVIAMNIQPVCNLFIQLKGRAGRKAYDCFEFANVCVSSHSHCTSLETLGTILLLRSLLPT